MNLMARAIFGCLSMAILAQAKAQIPDFTVPVANGTLYLYSNSYTGANTCRNSVEFLPTGFDINNTTKKYPLILFFGGFGEQWNANDPNTPLLVNFNDFIPNTPTGPNYVNPSELRLLRHPILRYILQKSPALGLSYTINATDFEFMVLSPQCRDLTPPVAIEDYDKFINDYFFVKYKDKIDFSRIYLTGLSLGGGKALEYMADPTRASRIAAVAPVAIRISCPYSATTTDFPNYPAQLNCADTSSYNAIVTNFVLRPEIGLSLFHYQDDENQPYAKAKRFFDDINFRSGSTTRAGGIFPTGGFHNLSYETAYEDQTAIYSFNGNNTNMYRWFLNFQNVLSPLPVSLLAFSAKVNNDKKVSLSWTTSSESNSSHFNVERSTNGKNFAVIGKVNAAGNSNIARKYEFTDEDPGIRTVYYRLSAIDKDGKARYSEIRKVGFVNTGMTFTVAPNPSRSDINVTIEGSTKSALTVSLFDQLGRKVKQLSLIKSQDRFTQKIDISDLVPGLYTISVQGDNIYYTQRLVKQ